MSQFAEDLTVEAQCESNSNVKLYAFTGVFGSNDVQEATFSCAEKFTLPAGYVTIIDLINLY